jgi:hypothetical protein
MFLTSISPTTLALWQPLVYGRTAEQRRSLDYGCKIRLQASGGSNRGARDTLLRFSETSVTVGARKRFVRAQSSRNVKLLNLFPTSVYVKSSWSSSSTPDTYHHGVGEDIFTFTFSTCKPAVHVLSFGVFVICGALLWIQCELLHMTAWHIITDKPTFTVLFNVYTESQFRYCSNSNNIIQAHRVDGLHACVNLR